MKKRYIWKNTDLKIDDWRDEYAEFCEINNITRGDDNALYDWMIGTNYNYLDDEHYNLDNQLDGNILIIADIGRWNGRVSGYRIAKTQNLNEILNITDDYFEIYGDGHNIRAIGNHHDGVNYYLFREIRRDRNIDNLLTAIYNGENITPAKLNYYTKSVYKPVAAVYGW